MADKKVKVKPSKLPAKSGKKAAPPKLFKRPLFWILVAIVGVTIFGQISSGSNQFTKIDTSKAMAAITRGDVESANIVDRDQKIQLILKPGVAISGATKVEASLPMSQGKSQFLLIYLLQISLQKSGM